MATLHPPELSGRHDGVFGIARRDGRLLLVQNLRTIDGEQRAVWDLPGGKVREEEHLPDALRREWAEETGLEADVGALRLVTEGEKRRRPVGPVLYRWRAFVFDVESRGDPVPGEGIVAAEWCTPEDVQARLTAPYHEALRRHLEGAPETWASVVWTDPVPDDDPSPDRLRRLLALAAAAAAGRGDLVESLVREARADGVESGRIEEALLQVVPYAGFPRTIAAFGRARPLLERAPEPGGPGSCATGPETFAAVYGETASRVKEGLRGLHPELEAWTLQFAYGRVLARPQLTLLERELLAVSILTGLGRLEAPLLGHMRAAMRLGATRPDVAAAIQAVPPVVGDEEREAAKALLRRL